MSCPLTSLIETKNPPLDKLEADFVELLNY